MLQSEVPVHPHTSCAELLSQEKFDEDLNYEHYHLHDPTPEKDMPLNWHEAPRWEAAVRIVVVLRLAKSACVSSDLH